ncbi:hypothetical protein YC2023_085127 [Brassica napus]
MFFWCFIYSYMQGLQIFNGSEDCELNLINKSQANHMRYFGQGQQLWQNLMWYLREDSKAFLIKHVIFRQSCSINAIEFIDEHGSLVRLRHAQIIQISQVNNSMKLILHKLNKFNPRFNNQQNVGKGFTRVWLASTRHSRINKINK